MLVEQEDQLYMAKRIYENVSIDLSNPKAHKHHHYIKIKKQIEKNWQLFAMVLPPLAFIILFNYVPMYGLQIAFKDFKPALGMWNSEWVGFKHFKKFFHSYQFKRVLGNTVK